MFSWSKLAPKKQDSNMHKQEVSELSAKTISKYNKFSLCIVGYDCNFLRIKSIFNCCVVIFRGVNGVFKEILKGWTLGFIWIGFFDDVWTSVSRVWKKSEEVDCVCVMDQRLPFLVTLPNIAFYSPTYIIKPKKYIKVAKDNEKLVNFVGQGKNCCLIVVLWCSGIFQKAKT